MERKDPWKKVAENRLMDERGSDRIDPDHPEDNLLEDTPEFLDFHAAWSRKTDLTREAAREKAIRNAIPFESLRDKGDFPHCTKGLMVRTKSFTGSVIRILDEGRKIEVIDTCGKIRTFRVSDLLCAS